MPNPLVQKNDCGTISFITGVGVDKEDLAFSNGICRKVNVIARLEVELAYYDFVVLLISLYVTKD